MKPTNFIRILAFTATSMLLWTCSKTDIKTSPLASRIVQRPAASSMNGPAACNCGTQPKGCATFVNCVKKLLGTENSITWTANWANCSTPNPADQACSGVAIEGESSVVTVCYMPGSCSELTCKITSPPTCLPCLPDIFCLPLTPSCNNKDDAYEGTFFDPTTNFRIDVTISADPKIAVTCGVAPDNISCNATLDK